MSLQTVFRLVTRDGPSSLQAFTEPIPHIGSSDLLVKVRSVSLNYRDVAIANSTYPLPVKDSVIPCSDMAGEVVEVGDEVGSFSIRDRVVVPVSLALLYGTVKDNLSTLGGPRDGVLRQYIALPEHAAIKLPNSPHSYSQWAGAVTTGSTVWNAFYGQTSLNPGHTVLLLGTGGVSLTGLIFAKAAGATTIITSSSDEKLEVAKTKYGADYTINYKTHPNWAAEVQRVTNGQGVDHVLDVGGSGTIQQSFESLGMGGTVSVIGFLSPATQDQMPDATWLALSKGAALRGILGGSKEQLEHAVRFIGSRELPIPVDKVYAFARDDIVAALEYVASGKHVGKVCINID
ncbi:hypothetical protein B0T10DRAFT_596404 [Thelonectria olida]|uniref:Enoyl reductase (ER) domain-containing protein n=1 Tax=Thelonectria olida TaxID=1576542 RepID=A0A9P8W4P2_9HYPO|nr:hypothetical protein B0T10DRAFT_596404 [Thelonectria olida]